MAAATAITPEQIAATESVIRPHIRRTPTLEVNGSEFGLASFSLILKLELCQHAGSFKTRGAFTSLLLRKVPQVGVCAASGGNHGAAVAYAAQKLGVPAKIFVPTVSSPAKKERIRSYGADLVVGGERYADALLASEEWCKQSGALSVHAYDQRETLLGQGTLGMELEQQVGHLDTVLAAVGGGGLLAGIASWYAGRSKMIGVEPEGAPSLFRALEAGHIVDVETGGVAVDSLGSRRVGELVLPIAQKYVDRAVLVSDDAIRKAQQMLWDRVRIIAEPGGATAFAALLSGHYLPQPGERVGVIVSGGNTTAVDFSR